MNIQSVCWNIFNRPEPYSGSERTMAGNRQHFIPQMLLRRFSDDSERARVLRRDGRTFVTSIANIGLENEFYGKPGLDTTHEAITQEENRIGAMLDAVNKEPEGSIENMIASKLIAHCTARLKGMRTYMEQASHLVLDTVGEQLSDGELIRQKMMENIRADPSDFIQSVHQRILGEYGPEVLLNFQRHPHHAEFIEMIAVELIRNVGTKEIFSNTQWALDQFRENVGGIAENAHNKAAYQAPTPEGRAKLLESFSFAIQDFEQDLVLGDSVGWGIRSSVGITPLFSLEDDLQAVVMPVSRRRIIIGWKGERPNFGAEDISTASAKVCEEFIVAHPDVSDISRLNSEFGIARTTSLQAMKNEYLQGQ